MTREEAIDVLRHNYPSTCFTDLCEAVDTAIEALFAQPEPSQVARDIADIIENEKDMRVIARSEIIHCRDCKHWQSEEHIGNNNVHTLNLASLPCKNWLTAEDWFCGSAERKEG